MVMASQSDRSMSRARRAVAVSRIEVFDGTYMVQRVPPLKVIGIARRLSAFASSALNSAAALEKARNPKRKPEQAESPADGETEEQGKMEALAVIATLFHPLMDSLARMPESDQDYVIGACLRCVNDPTDQAHPNLWNDATGAPVATLSAGEVLAITGEVLKLVLPELWGELQQVMGSVAASFMQGAAEAG